MRADDVYQIVIVLEERLTNAVKALERLESECKGNAQSHGDLRQQVGQVLPVLQHAVQELKQWREDEAKEHETYVNLKRDVDDLKKWKDEAKKQKDEHSRRLWSFGPNLVAALITIGANFILLAINLYFMFSMKKSSP